MSIAVGQTVPDASVEYWRRGAPGAKHMELSHHRGEWL